MATKQEIIDKLSQCGGLSYSDWIKLLDSIYFDGDIGNIYEPVDTTALPIPEDTFSKFTIVTEGTYTQSGQPDIVVPSGNMAVLNWDGTLWTLGSLIELPMKQGVNVVAPNNELPTNNAVINHTKPLFNVIDISPQIFDRANDEILVATMTPTTNIQPSVNGFLLKIPVSKLPVGTEFSWYGDYPAPSGSAKVLFMDASNNRISAVPTTAGLNDKKGTATVPANTAFTYIHAGYYANADQLVLRNNVVINSMMIVKGATPIPVQEFGASSIKMSAIPRNGEITDLLDAKVLVNEPVKNLIDPANINFARRYSVSSGGFQTSQGTQYVDLGFIKVKPKGKYVITQSSGNSLPSGLTWTGGYFATSISTVRIAPIVFELTEDGNGMYFEVPDNELIGGVHINGVRYGLNTTDTDLIGTHQLESGVVGTEIDPFEIGLFYNEAYMRPTEQTVVPVTPVQLPKPTILLNLPKTSKAFFAKEKNVTIVKWGTSLFANNYSPVRTDANKRPPLADTYNVFSQEWDKLYNCWAGQQYRRYDFAGMFTETGSFSSVAGLPEWDDSQNATVQYRKAWTRHSVSTGAGVSFIVPAEAWQFNFIYRTSLNGGVCVVTVQEGDGKFEVFNGTSWVEANGYEFTMQEPPATLTKGNTTFQKRLLGRAKSGTFNSIGEIKTISIVKAGAGNFDYWGVEWSPREFMFTMINASRGSHAIRNPSEALSLVKYQDNDVYGHNPDCIFAEITIINLGAGNTTVVGSRSPLFYTNIVQEYYFNPSQVNSIFSKTNGFVDIEVVLFSDSVPVNQGAYNSSTGEPIFLQNQLGKVQSCMDNWDYMNDFIKNKNVNYVDMFGYFRDYAVSAYGGYYNAMKGSGTSALGATLTVDGIHYSINGDKLVGSILLQAFNFDPK